ncbi:MATE family efflux transporter [Caviibacter abscessus]|uniref:MATE family efflux transporter n=1 Tax=Caviibacter abscessus TaxID=1766719 RepID=UPI001E3D17EC|nr:MATE family efflux transporter [Caviibacter abscessus]
MALGITKLDMESRRKLILDGNVWTTLLILCIPTIMMAVVQSMIPFTDGLFLNRTLGPERTSAITYAKPSIDIMIGLSQGLGFAAMAMIGQMVGKGDVVKVKKISLQILIFSIICGIFLIPVSILVAYYMSTTVADIMKADVFIYICLYSFVIPLQFLAAIFNAIKNAEGNPESPFYRMIVLLVLKILFNFIFLKIFNFGIKGAVFASFCAYVVTAIWMYYDLFIKKYLYTLDLREYRYDGVILTEVIRLGIPSMFNFMMINLGFLLINMEIENYGRVVLAGLGIAGNINSLCFQLPACVSTTVTTMISLNIGIGNATKAKKVFRVGMIISLIIAFLTTITVLPLSSIITKMFTSQKNVLEVANESLKYYTYSIIPFGITMICQAVFNAVGKTFIPLFMGFLRIWLFRYLFIISTQVYLGYCSVFMGNLFSNALAAIVFLVLVKKLKWETGMKYGKK